jgi:hypothetical protein
MKILGALALVAMCLFIVGACTSLLAKKKSSHVNLVWYFSSLAMVIAGIVILLASQYGIISPSGSFAGEHGETLKKVMDAMFDIQLDFQIFVGIFAIALLPQIISYGLSSFSGSAGPILLFGFGLDFVFWGLVKSLITAAGITFAMLLGGLILKWDGFRTIGGLAILAVALIFLATAFALITLRTESSEVLTFISKYIPKRLLAAFKRFNENATRNRLKQDFHPAHKIISLASSPDSNMAAYLAEGGIQSEISAIDFPAIIKLAPGLDLELRVRNAATSKSAPEQSARQPGA